VHVFLLAEVLCWDYRLPMASVQTGESKDNQRVKHKKMQSENVKMGTVRILMQRHPSF